MISGGTLPSNISLSFGFDAEKPADPKPGEVYIATDSQKIYTCYIAGVWKAGFSASDLTKANIDSALGFTSKDLTKANIDIALGFTSKDLTSASINSAIGGTAISSANFDSNFDTRFNSKITTAVNVGVSELFASNLSEVSLVCNTAWSTFKTFTIDSIDGGTFINGLSVVFDSQLISLTSYFAVYVNGVSKDSASSTNTSYVTRTLNINEPLSAGDVIEIKQRTGSSSGTLKIRNAYLKGDVSVIPAPAAFSIS